MPADVTHSWCLDRLSAHIDSELDATESLDVARHLSNCAACASEYTRLVNTMESMRRHLPPLRAPDALRARVVAAMHPATIPREHGRRFARAPRAWLAAAAMAVMTGGAYVAGTYRSAPGATQTAESVLTAHVRSLQQGHLTDVTSTDQHTVKPWFTGKVDFAPTVPVLDSVGFPLRGGRLDYLAGRAVAALVYQRRSHIINVLTYPSEPGDAIAPHLESRRGFQLANWSASGMTYWVVSDLGAEELRVFCTLLRQANAAH